MSYIDIIIIIFLLYGALRGFKRGLIIEIATLAGLVLGFYISISYSRYMEVLLHDFFNVSSHYVAFGLTFIVVTLGVFLLGKMLTKIADIICLGLINKLLGMLLGMAKYALVVCGLLLIVGALDDKFHFISEETRQKSIFFLPFLNFARKMYETIRF